jgi:hypothetical protein
MTTMPPDFNPFDIFEQFFGDLGGSGFSGFGGPGRTRVTFNNGSGSFTVFSSGFGGNSFFSGMDDDDVNPFEELFFGNRRQRNRNNGHSNNRNSNTRRRNNEQARRDLENNMKNITLCIQLFPLICCTLVFFVIPWLIKIITP